jgi:hypothetical protein
MANYRAIVKHHPEVRDYIRLRKWVHRGETVFYAPNTESDTLSTDAAGFRNGMWQGARLTLADCLKADRYGLVMGPSNVYGFGVPDDGHTIPSRLGEMLGLPFGNIGLPEGHTRNLFAILLNIVTRTAHPPAAVLLLTGGDFTGWAYSGIADPVFGPPNILQLEQVLKERGGPGDPVAGSKAMLAASHLWTVAIVQLCRGRRIPLVLGNDTTFFEKREPDSYDLDCRLGEASSPPQKRQFEIHRKFGVRFYEQRQQISERLGIPLVGPGPSNQIGFIDEFHYDAPGTDALCAEFAPALEEALKGGES